jgi:hypothetical protein
MQKKYHLFFENAKSGPFDAKEVLARNAARAGGGAMLIWSAEMGEWKPLESHLPMLITEASAPYAQDRQGTQEPSPQAGRVAPEQATRRKVGPAAIAAIVVVAAAGAFFVWQKFAPQAVQGKILIVQKNAEVRKLALVKVEVLDKAQTQRWASASQAKLEEHIELASKSTKQLRAKMADLMKDAPEVSQRYSSLGRSIYIVGANALLLNINRSNRIGELGPKEAGWMIEMKENIAKIKFLLPGDIDSLVEKREFHKIYLAARYDGFRNLESMAKNEDPSKAASFTQLIAEADDLRTAFSDNSRAIMFEIPQDLPRAATETSDGDGQFIVKLPAGEYAFVASSSRVVANSEEKYYWALGFTVASGSENKIMLGNQNLESGDARSVWSRDTSLSVERARLELAAISLELTKMSKEYKSPKELVEECRKELQSLKDS